MQNIDEEIGFRLKARRYELGLRLEDVVKNTPIDTSTLSRYENGQAEPSFIYIGLLADRLKLSLDYIYKGKLDETEEARNELYSCFEECLKLSIEDLNALTRICNNFIDLKYFNEAADRKTRRAVKR
ncbi:MAG: helix-turn-helix transcriptional regulator [Bacteroidota bacterium]